MSYKTLQLPPHETTASEEIPFSTKKYGYFFLFLYENLFCGYLLEAPTVLSTSFRKSFFAWRFTPKK